MRNALVSLLIAASGAVALAQDHTEFSAAVPAGSQLLATNTLAQVTQANATEEPASRKALLKSALGQAQQDTSALESASRKALLKSAVARDRGDITAMEALAGDSAGVIIGYSSGAVVNCRSNQHCREFDGTPDTTVVDITVSRRGGLEIIWIAYRHGVLYECANYACNEVSW